MSDREMDIEEPVNPGSESDDEASPIFEAVVKGEQMRPLSRGLSRKEIKEEKAEVGELFKELVTLVNSHMNTKNTDNNETSKSMGIAKPPPFSRKKSKFTKHLKDLKNVEPVEEVNAETHEVKGGRKPSTKMDKK